MTAAPTFPELGQLDLAGNRLPFNSKYEFTLDGQYSLPLANGSALELAATYHWRGKKYFDAYNLENAFQPDVGVLDARIRYAADNWYVEAFGRNLTDETIISQSSNSGEFTGYQILGQLEPPRTYGVRLGLKY